MAVRPLRPATDRRLGRPLPHQLANRARAPLQAPGSEESPALISTCPKAGCYAVLASLSRRYPPLEGRSPTCYSPVCHFTQGRSPFHVRLACVRHAASVDSEPGSNSHVKVGASPGIPDQANLNASACRLLRCSCVECRRARTTTPPHGRLAARTHRLILDGHSGVATCLATRHTAEAGRRDPRALRRRASPTHKCLHVLSSFQRTGLASTQGLGGSPFLWGTFQSY